MIMVIKNGEDVVKMISLNAEEKRIIEKFLSVETNPKMRYTILDCIEGEDCYIKFDEELKIEPLF